MNFIKQMIVERNLKEEEKLKEKYSSSILKMENFIYFAKEDLLDLAENGKNITIDVIDDFLDDVEMLEAYYEKFLYELKEAEFTYKETYFKNVKEESKKKAEFMHKLKKQYRAEFENIYNSFKRLTKDCNLPQGYNIPKRNEILGKMRKAFDFDSTKYYAPDQYIIMR